uniref:Uncharacterized protein n=1 Tax=Mycena chlorophos TaxID=658473 RepID=A0ABQ0LGF8_MYCCL|nr:predicted protein [Mycena chlorophos]
MFSSSVVALRSAPRLARSVHSAFGAMAPRALPPNHSEAETSANNGRINVVATPTGANMFNGVPLGAYQVSTPYHGQTNAQSTKQTKGEPRKATA